MNIYKYTISAEHNSKISLRDSALILDIQYQNDQLTMWVMEDARYDYVDRNFTIWWTGEMIPYDYRGRHLKTLQCPNGLVLHIFEDIK